jgi:hypothetical protein
MSFLGKLARGAATGLSGYYGEVAKQQDDERKMNLLAQREQALANLNHTNRLGEIAATGAEQRLSDTNRGEVDTAGKLALIGPAKEAKIAATEAEAEARYQAWRKQWLEQFPAEQRAEKEKIDLRAKYDKEMEGTRQAGQDRRSAADREAYLNTHPVAETTAADGTPVISYAPGARVRETKITGAHWPGSKGKSDDDEFSAGGIAPRAPAVAASKPDDRFVTRYVNANPATAPGLFRNNEKIPLEEAWRLYQDGN